jgi:hypothetical protein
LTYRRAVGELEGAPGSCLPKYKYVILSNSGEAWEVVNEQTDQNTTPNSATVTLTSTSASTVSTSASINITVDAGAALGVVFASVHADLNASVAKTVSTVVGNNYNVTIPPGKTAYGIYGVQVQVTTGNLDQSNVCGTTANYNSIQTYVPIAPGWCVWLSGETPCRVVHPS